MTYTFNKASQLGLLQDWAGRSVGYTYWPDGLVKTATNPDATVATYAYDNARRLVDIAHTTSAAQLIDRSFYMLDQVGNVANVNHGLLAAQVARPDGYVGSNGTWTGTFASVNEVVPNDSTFLASPSSPASPNYYEVSLSNVQPPMDKTAIKIHYRIAKSGNNSGQTISMLVELRQGSTVVYSGSYQSLPGATGSGWLDDTVTVSAQQAQTITDYNDLRLRFTPTSSGGGQARKAQISWVEVNVPSPADPAASTSYGYDRMNRLTSSSGPDGAPSYAYDPVGNRLSKTLSGTTTYTYDRADRITAAGATSITVNANGNTTAKGTDSFAYDGGNRLKSATVSNISESYTYDGDGTRFSRQIGTGTPIRYVSDIGRGLPVTIDDGTRKYVYGLGLAYAVSGTTAEVYHADRLGSVRAITTNGSVVATYSADDWGNVIAQTGSSTQPFGFTGEPRDGTALAYLRARYYDPSLGRFMSRDSWHGIREIPRSLNDYAYLRGNPLSGADADGHCGPPCAIAGGVIGGLGGLGGYLLSGWALGRPFDPGQAFLATAGGATTGAVCGVTFGATCFAVGGATSLAQYAASPGQKTAGGVIKSLVLGGTLGWLARGGIFNGLTGGVRYDVAVAPGMIGNFMANWTYGWNDALSRAFLSALKSSGTAFIGNGAPQVPLQVP